MAQKDHSVTYPLVSVCMPAFNAEQYIGEAIESVLNQTYPNIELIVADDGSKDNTLAIVEENFRYDRIVLCKQKNRGAAAARNLAFRQSNGVYIKFLDADDLISKTMIESQVRYLLENSNSVISSSWGRFSHDDLDSFTRHIENFSLKTPPCPWLINSWKGGESMTQPGMFLIPRNIICQAGLWDEKLGLLDDLDFFTRIILNSDGVVFDENSTLYYRSGIGGLSTVRSDIAVLSAFNAIDNSTRNLLKADNCPEAVNACANLWQNFIYTFYPKLPDLLDIAAKHVKELKGSDLPYPSGGLTKIMANIIGWKATKKIKLFLNS